MIVQEKMNVKLRMIMETTDNAISLKISLNFTAYDNGLTKNG